MSRNIRLEVSFSYEDATHQRCMLTYKSPRGGSIRFASSRVDIGDNVQTRTRALTEQEISLVKRVRRASMNAYGRTEIIRLAPSFATFGPYLLKDIANRNAAILRAICEAYLDYDKLYLTFTDNWPKTLIFDVKHRLLKSDCAEYVAGFD